MPVRLHYEIDGQGPPIVMLHPVGIDRTFMKPVADYLTGDYRVVRIDARGHGLSPAEPPAETLDDYVDDIHALLMDLKLGPAAVAGFSFGGMLAQLLALKYPADVAALLPCACPSTMTPERRVISARRGTDALANGMASIMDETMTRWYTPAFQAAGKDRATREHLMARGPEVWAYTWRTMAQLDAHPRLGEIRVPTLCIAGEVDASSSPEIVKRMADAIPGARFAVVPGAPHMLFIEQPAEVAHLIRAFLDEVMGV